MIRLQFKNAFFVHYLIGNVYIKIKSRRSMESQFIVMFDLKTRI